jgi:acetylornithine deacetylase
MDKESLQKKIKEIADNSKEAIYETLTKLVQIPSVVGEEGRAQEFMAKLYDKLGLEVHVFEADRNEIAKHKKYLPLPWSYQNRPNVIGIYKGSGGGKSLILNGHIDTVSPEPTASWSRSPWSGHIENGKLYGRGACDMKCGLIANYYALKILLDLGLKLKGDVLLQSVIEEEAGGSGGTLATLLKGYTADAMLISEPMGYNLITAHAGTCYFRVKVKGKPAHGGEAHKGVNAIGKMFKIYQALEALEKKRGEEVHYELFDNWLGRSANLCIGSIKGGDWPSTVAGWAELECRISFIPGEELADIREVVKQTVSAACRGDKWLEEHPPEIEFFGWQTEAWEQNAADPFIQLLKNKAEEVLGQEVSAKGFPAGLDTRFASDFDIPCVCLGPTGELHIVDEYVNKVSMFITAMFRF